jgi:hypothetical protein
MTPERSPEKKIVCPHCHTAFDFFIGPVSGINDGTPVVCEQCCEVGIVDAGTIRKLTPEETERTKKNTSVQRLQIFFQMQKRAMAARWN